MWQNQISFSSSVPLLGYIATLSTNRPVWDLCVEFHSFRYTHACQSGINHADHKSHIYLWSHIQVKGANCQGNTKCVWWPVHCRLRNGSLAARNLEGPPQPVQHDFNSLRIYSQSKTMPSFQNPRLRSIWIRRLFKISNKGTSPDD